MRTQTIRIAEADHAVLSEMSKTSGKPMSAILADAIQELRRTRLLRQTNEAYARLRQDPKAWREETAERSLWDSTLADGME
jgi:hypothetical protein